MASMYGLASSSTEIDKTLNQLQQNVSKESTEELSNKMDKLISLVEEIHVANREKTSTLIQMIFTLEDNLNKRIDSTRTELFERLQLDAANGTGGNRPTTLKAIFDKNFTTSVSTLRGVISTITIIPEAGFVIKTKKLLGQQDKCFINVFHHPRVELEPVNIPKGQAHDKPYIIIGSILSTEDKKGGFSYVYNIVVSSEYFSHSESLSTEKDKDNELRITSPESIIKIIHKVNLKYDDFLDESTYSLPRLAVGFKGKDIHPIQIPVLGGSVEPDYSSPHNIPSGKDKKSLRRRSTMESIHEDDNGSVVSDLSDAFTHAEHSSEYSPFSATDGTPPERKTSATRRGSGGAIGVGGGVAGSTSHVKKEHRKSLFDTKHMAYSGGDIVGRNLLHGDMCDYIQEDTVDAKTAQSLKTESITRPTVLLGWQIKIDEQKEGTKQSILYVVTDVRKNFIQKSEFRISRFKHADKWELLKRKENKPGIEFRPMRKVLFGLEDEEDDADLTSLASTNINSLASANNRRSSVG